MAYQFSVIRSFEGCSAPKKQTSPLIEIDSTNILLLGLFWLKTNNIFLKFDMIRAILVIWQNNRAVGNTVYHVESA